MTWLARLKENLAPWNTGTVTSGKTDLERYEAAVAKMFEPVAELAEETGSDGEAGYVPPYGTLFNPNTVPTDAMKYLAQYVGVELPEGGTEAEWRATLKAESGIKRGTKASLELLLVKALGVKPFFILERTQTVEGDNAYWVTVIIPTGGIPASTYTEINGTIPAGIWYTILERAGTIFVGTKKISEINPALKISELAEGNY